MSSLVSAQTDGFADQSEDTDTLRRPHPSSRWLGFAVVLLLSPWLQILGGGNYPIRQIRLWHAPFFHEPLQGRYFAVIVDYRRMLKEFVAGEAFVLALYFTWARPSR
jgi:hypothetical protein